MLSEEELSRLCVVLVRARDPNNIGAVARAMHDFGFRDLRLVNEYHVPYERAKSAVDASAVLDAAEEYPSVAEAVADCTVVVGTTALGPRRREHPVFALAEAGGRLRSELASSEGRVAILFGSEKTGLSNEELSHCQFPRDYTYAPDRRHAARLDEPRPGGRRLPLRTDTRRANHAAAEAF